LVIDNVELLAYELPIITIKVVCSKGTYIRALARDIGRELGSGAHLTGLVRTRVGDATLDQCLQVSELDRFFDENIKNDSNFLIK
jgi:tRNA pseudouridine55 synthase